MKKIVKAWSFPSGSDPSRVYQALQYEDSSLSCDCPGWTRRVAPDGSRTCKHVRAVELGTADSQATAVKNYGKVKAPIKTEGEIDTNQSRRIQWK